MSVLPIGIGSEESGYRIERSLRFNSSDSAYMTRTPASAGNRKTWTWSGWVKRSRLGTEETLFACGTTASDTAFGQIVFSSDNKLRFNRYYDTLRGTNAVYRDVSAWYHIVVVLDTPNATAADRAILYVNNERVTSFEYSNDPTQNIDLAINQNIQHTIGRYDLGGGGNYLSTYLTEVHFIDGQALTPSSFGETDSATGVWKPKAYTGSYGTNGFSLKFADNSGTTSTTLGKDSSGNGNNWTPNNFSVTAGAGNDSLVDTPTPYGTDTGAGGEVRGNYATLNPIVGPFTNTTFSNGNLNMVVASGYFGKGATGTFLIPRSGKYYFEVLLESGSGTAGGVAFGFGSLNKVYGDGADLTVGSWTIQDNGDIRANGSIVSTVSSWNTDGKICGVAINYDASEIKFYVDNSLQATLSGANFPTVDVVPYIHNGARGVVANFGQRPFAYTAPSGFKALCTQNLPEPTVVQGDDYFNTVLYTGNSGTQAITSVGFQPDLLWLKRRDAGNAGRVFDAVRGKDNYLITSSTAAEANFAYLSSFDSNGFTLNSGDSATNTSGGTYVAWNWKANGSGVSNTAGSITSTVSANTTSGFSIVTWTGNGTIGATIGHGLGVVPALLIFKNRSTTDNWLVKTNQLSTNSYLYLNLTNAAGTASSFWPNDPTSSLIYLGDNTATNGSGNSMVCYAFAPVAGFSAFGSYTGNGSADGPFIYTGFRPAWLLIKRTDAVDEWELLDAKRNPENIVTRHLHPNRSNAEATNNWLDFTSNGFKIRDTNSGVNTSSGTYIYACFAENPFKYSLAR